MEIGIGAILFLLFLDLLFSGMSASASESKKEKEGYWYTEEAELRVKERKYAE